MVTDTLTDDSPTPVPSRSRQEQQHASVPSLPNADNDNLLLAGGAGIDGVGSRSVVLPKSAMSESLLCCGLEATKAQLVPTRRGLDSSPALFLWESRTTNVDIMSVSNTTRPVAVSR